MIEKKFDIPFIADLALREKQIQQNYRPIIAVHKWFARRPGMLYRGLLLSEFLEKPLHESFYQANSLKGIKVADANSVGIMEHKVALNNAVNELIADSSQLHPNGVYCILILKRNCGG